MKSYIIKWFIIAIAIVLGYASMGLFITAVQEWTFHGVSYHKSSLLVLGLAGLGTFLSAIAGGWIAFKVNSSQTKIANYVMCVLVVCETTWLIASGRADGPLWFDILAALSLIAGILLGGNLHWFSKSEQSLPSH